MKWICRALITLLLLAGCAPSAPVVPEKQPLGETSLSGALAGLPRAQTGTQPLSITYPKDALFTDGAALFYAGGPETLEPLAAVLLAYPRSRWQGTVTAQSPFSAEHAQALALARSRLLLRYLQRKGIAAERLTLTATPGEGADLRLILVTPQEDNADSSSSEKR